MSQNSTAPPSGAPSGPEVSAGPPATGPPGQASPAPGGPGKSGGPYGPGGPAAPDSGPERTTRVNKTVFFGSATGVVGIALWAILAKDNAEAVIGSMVGWVSTNMGWYYFLIVTAVVAFVLVTALSRVGKTKLGPDHSKPQFGMFTWAAMLFAAGIGIDLMFFSVSEPVSQYLAPPQGEGGNRGSRTPGPGLDPVPLRHHRLGALRADGAGPGLLRLPAQPSAEHPLRAVPDLRQEDRGPGGARRGHRRPARHHLRHRHLAGHRRGPAQLRVELHVRHSREPRGADRPDRAVRGDGHRLRGLRRGEGHPAAVRAQRDHGRGPDAVRAGGRQDQLPAGRHRAEHRRRHEPLPVHDPGHVRVRPAHRLAERLDAVLLGLVDCLGALRRAFSWPASPAAGPSASSCSAP